MLVLLRSGLALCLQAGFSAPLKYHISILISTGLVLTDVPCLLATGVSQAHHQVAEEALPQRQTLARTNLQGLLHWSRRVRLWGPLPV